MIHNEDEIERRRISWDVVLESIHRIEMKLMRVDGHMRSELGGEGTQGNINYHLTEIRKDLEKVINDYEKRFERLELKVSKIEENYWKAVGAVSVLALVANLFFKWLVK